MSLFRGAEHETLPLLTRVSHVDVTRETEVIEWLLLELPAADREEWEQANADVRPYGTLASLRTILIYTQKVMNSAQQGKRVDEYDLNELSSQYKRLQGLVLNTAYENDRQPGEFRIVHHQLPPGGVPALEWQILNDLLDHQKLFNRCVECGHVYQRSRSTQQFCSDRCGSRARMRERKKTLLKNISVKNIKKVKPSAEIYV